MRSNGELVVSLVHPLRDRGDFASAEPFFGAPISGGNASKGVSNAMACGCISSVGRKRSGASRAGRQRLQIEKIAQTISVVETEPRAITAISKMRSSNIITLRSKDKSPVTGFRFKVGRRN